jgi:hypothetical protein
VKLKIALFLIASCAAGSLVAQPRAAELDTAALRQQILNQWWACEKQKTKECDMRLLVIKPEGFEMNCVNWSAGFSGLKCKYILNMQDGFFELELKEYPNAFQAKYVYGYLSENELLLLTMDKALALSPRLLSETGWLKFERIKR